MRKRLLCIFMFCFIASCSIGFGSYIIDNLQINGADNDVKIGFVEDKTNYKKVIFNNLYSIYGYVQTIASNESDYIYVKKGTYLTLDDLPVEITDSLVERKKANGETVLSILNNGFSGGFLVNEDLDLYPSKIDVQTASSPTTEEIKKNEDNVDDDGNLSVSSNNIRVEEGTNDRNTTTEIVVDKGILNNVNFETTFKDQDGNENIKR